MIDIKLASETDFPVWCIVRDGMQAPPFTNHVPRRGPLTRAGLDAQGWINWLSSEARQEIETIQSLRQFEDGKDGVSERKESPFRSAASLLDPGVFRIVASWWNEYQGDLSTRRRTNLAIHIDAEYIAEFVRHNRDIEFMILAVEYPGRVWYPITRHAAIVRLNSQRIDTGWTRRTLGNLER